MYKPRVLKPRVFVLLLSRPDGIVLVQMPNSVTITYKASKTTKQDTLVATFDENEWARLQQDLRAYKVSKENPSGDFYWCVVEDKGSEPRQVFLDFTDIRLIV